MNKEQSNGLEHPRFSIIVPAYNIERYIAECILSIIGQTFGSWELIIVDDGSTDKTASICKSYVENDPRIKYIYKDNSGQSDARNLGIEKAIGE